MAKAQLENPRFVLVFHFFLFPSFSTICRPTVVRTTAAPKLSLTKYANFYGERTSGVMKSLGGVMSFYAGLSWQFNCLCSILESWLGLVLISVLLVYETLDLKAARCLVILFPLSELKHKDFRSG